MTTTTTTSPSTSPETVAAIAAALPGAWIVKPLHEGPAAIPYRLTGPGGVTLTLTGGGYGHPKAWRVSAYQDAKSNNGERITANAEPPAANISTTKNPEQIAREIARRILPGAQAARAEVVERLAKANEAESGQAETSAELSRILGAPVRGADRGDPQIYAHGVTFRVSYGGGSVEVKTYGLPRALALKIAALVAEHGEAE